MVRLCHPVSPTSLPPKKPKRAIVSEDTESVSDFRADMLFPGRWAEKHVVPLSEVLPGATDGGEPAGTGQGAMHIVGHLLGLPLKRWKAGGGLPGAAAVRVAVTPRRGQAGGG